MALLGDIGSEAETAAPILERALQSHPLDFRAFNAAWALWRIDPRQKLRARSIFAALRAQSDSGPNPDPGLQWSALGALWQMAPEMRDELRPDLLGVLEKWKTDPTTGRLRPEMRTLLPALAGWATDDNDPELRRWSRLMMRGIRQTDFAAPD